MPTCACIWLCIDWSRWTNQKKKISSDQGMCLVVNFVNKLSSIGAGSMPGLSPTTQETLLMHEVLARNRWNEGLCCLLMISTVAVVVFFMFVNPTFCSSVFLCTSFPSAPCQKTWGVAMLLLCVVLFSCHCDSGDDYYKIMFFTDVRAALDGIYDWGVEIDAKW